MGLPVTYRAESAAPPRASPSSLVRIRPVTPMRSSKALEINPNHPIFEKLKDLYANDKDKLKDYAKG